MWYFTGSTNFALYKCLWRTWAPLRAKVFLWLTIMGRCCTADRLAHHGLQRPEHCPFCDQEEDIQHILLHVCSPGKSGLEYYMPSACHVSPDQGDDLQQWWIDQKRRVPREKKGGLNPLIILVAWTLWKHMNQCTFDHARPTTTTVAKKIVEEATMWKMDGARKLQLLE